MTKKKAPELQLEGESRTPNHQEEGSVMGKVHHINPVREATQESDWLRENDARVAAAQPGWADKELTWVDFHMGEADMVVFERAIGTVRIEQSFSVSGDDIVAMGATLVRITAETPDTNTIAHDWASQVGVDLIRAGQAINGPGDLSVSMIEIVANALGVSPGDVYAVGEKR